MARQLWLCFLVGSAQEIGPLVDFSTEYPERLNEELVMNVIRGDFILEAELGLETNFEDVDRVLRGTLGQICQHEPFTNAPVTVERFLDMESLVLRRKAFRYKWWLLPLQSHPLPGDCMSTLAQMSFGPSEPPFEEIGKKMPPIRNLFAIELATYTETAAMDSTGWGLTLQNVSCIPHTVRRAIFDGQEDESTTTVVPTHVCDGRLYATGNGEDKGFDPGQVADCGMGKEDPCLCLTLQDCEWQPGSGDLPGGCAATANPGVACEACPFQEKCREATQSELCRLANNGCECAFTRPTSNGYGCAWISGTCLPRSTALSAATACDACPTQVRCGTPVLYTIRPNAGTLMGELGVWTVKVYFDRPIYTMFQVDDTGIAMRCNTWEPTGGTTYRLGASKLSVVDNILEINLKNVVSDKRKTCVLSIAANVLRSVQSDLPYGGVNDGAYFVFLPDTEEPTVSKFEPPNSIRGLGREVEVKFSFTELIFPGPEASAQHVDLYETGNTANAGTLLESIQFSSELVTVKDDYFKVKLSGLEPSKFYSVVLPPLSLSDRQGNNFTGLPRNYYMIGTGSDTTLDEGNWSQSLFIVLGIVLVAVLVALGGVAGYFLLTSGQENAKVFAKQVRNKSKGASQADPVQVEDLDDGFYTQKPAVEEAVRAEGSNAVEAFRQQHHVAVAWDAASKPGDHSLSLSGSFSRSLHVAEMGGVPHSHHAPLQAQSVSPHNSPRPSGVARPGSTPRPAGSPRPDRPSTLDEGFGSRSGSQVAALHAQRSSSQLALPGSVPSKARSPSSKESPAGRTLSKSTSKISVHSYDDRSLPTKVHAPVAEKARPRAPGGGHQGPQLPSEPSPELAGISVAKGLERGHSKSRLDRGSSKMSLSGTFQGPLTAGLAGPAAAGGPSTLAESAAVSRSMSKALRSNTRPLSRGQQTPVRANK